MNLPSQAGNGPIVFMFSLLVVAAFIAFGVYWLNKPVKPCEELVAMSRTCLPFGCSKTYINERGEDTGECR